MKYEELTLAKSLPNQPLYSPKEVAAFLGVTQTTISTWCREGRLDGFKAGKHWKYVTRQSLKEFVEGGSVCEVTRGAFPTMDGLDRISPPTSTRPTLPPAKPIPVRGWNPLASEIFEENALENTIQENSPWIKARPRTTSSIHSALFPEYDRCGMERSEIIDCLNCALMAADYTPSDNSNNPTWT